MYANSVRLSAFHRTKNSLNEKSAVCVCVCAVCGLCMRIAKQKSGFLNSLRDHTKIFHLPFMTAN